MPFVSIILPTMRVGGLDVTMFSLQNQTYTDFELILIDGIYDYRKDIISDKLKEYNFPIIHISPVNNQFPQNSMCRYYNTGLKNASGKLVLFTCDYMYLPPECIETHVKSFIENGEKSGLMCPFKYIRASNLSDDFPVYLNHEYIDHSVITDTDYFNRKNNINLDNYINDLSNHKLDKCMWSIFENNFIESPISFYEGGGSDPKISAIKGAVAYGSDIFNSCYIKNDSCSLESLLLINGFDEDLDTTHGYQDSDIIDRLSLKAGVNWFVDPSQIGLLFNVKLLFPFGKRLFPISKNKEIWQNKKQSNYTISNKSILKEETMINKPKYVSIWLGARQIDDEHYNFIKSLMSDYSVTVYGNKIYEKEGFTINNYEAAMSSNFTSDLFIIVDEPWAIDFGKAHCKILWIKSDDVALPLYDNINQQVIQIKNVICNSQYLKNKFTNVYKFVSEKAIIMNENNLKEIVEKSYKESLWNPVQPCGNM